MRIRESILAIGAALAAALGARLVLQVIVMAVNPLLARSEWVTAHMTIVTTIAFIVGFLFMAWAAGAALGRLMPGHPIVHVLAVGVASPLLGYASSGPTALAHGWQIAAYAGQLCVIGVIAMRIYDRRQRLPAASVSS